MEVTNVRLKKVDTGFRMKAVATVTFDDEFVVHDVRVVESKNGLFIAMPSKKTPSGEYRDIAHPINPATRDKIQTSVLAAYNTADAEETPVKVSAE